MSRAFKTLTGEHFMVTHTVGNGGMRLDQFLMKRYRSRSREKLKRAIDSGAITIDRSSQPHHTMGKIKPSFVLRYGDVVRILSKRKPEPPVNFNYQVLHEDEHIVVVNKPANLPVHPAGKYFFHTLLVHLKTNGFQADLQSERKYFLAHRIDKETSGILVLSKDQKTAGAANAMFAKRETEKYYLAIVHGIPAQKEFIVDKPLGKKADSLINLKMHHVPVEEGGAPSVTEFKVLDTAGKFSLLACYPKTGRQHQIRAHADMAGHPLVGDKIYGLDDAFAVKLLESHKVRGASQNVRPDPEELTEDTDLNITEDFPEETSENELPDFDEITFDIPGPTLEMPAELHSRLLLPRHALHAAGLIFPHPATGKRMQFEAPLPDDLRKFFDEEKARSQTL